MIRALRNTTAAELTKLWSLPAVVATALGTIVASILNRRNQRLAFHANICRLAILRPQNMRLQILNHRKPARTRIWARRTVCVVDCHCFIVT